MSATPDVSVLIPVLNEADCIRETVAAMQAQELDGLGLELLFVDGASTDDTKAILLELAREDPRIRVLDNPDRTTAIALNIALREARGRYVARMDAHSFFPPRYLALGIERLERGDGVEQVCGPMLPRGTGRWSRRVSLALATRLGMGGASKWEAVAGDRSEPIEVELDTGVFAGVWRRETIDRLGGWDDGFPANQDSELAARILADGGRIVCRSEMAADYLPRDSLRGLWRQYSRYGFYRAKTASRHPDSVRRSHVLAPGLMLTLLAALLAPRPLRTLARLGVLLYAAAVGAETVKAVRRGTPPHVAAGLPAVFATLHASWGAGFLLGLARFGGWRALAGALLGRPRRER